MIGQDGGIVIFHSQNNEQENWAKNPILSNLNSSQTKHWLSNGGYFLEWGDRLFCIFALEDSSNLVFSVMKKTVFTFVLIAIGICLALNGSAQNNKISKSAKSTATTKPASTSSLINVPALPKEMTEMQMIMHPFGVLTDKLEGYTQEQVAQDLTKLFTDNVSTYETSLVTVTNLNNKGYDMSYKGYPASNCYCYFSDGKLESYSFSFHFLKDEFSLEHAISIAKAFISKLEDSKSFVAQKAYGDSPFKASLEGLGREINVRVHSAGYRVKDDSWGLFIDIRGLAKYQNAVTNEDTATETSSENLLAKNKKPETNSLGVASKGANSSNPLERYTVSHEGMYGQQRIGEVYYLGPGMLGSSIWTVVCEMVNGVYTIRLGHGLSHKLKEITSTSFVFGGHTTGFVMSPIGGASLSQIPTTITVSKDWETIETSGGSVLTREITKEYRDKCIEFNKQVYYQGVANGIITLDSNTESEVAKQLQADIEESQRKIDGMNNKSSTTYEKRDEMNRGHTVIRYKSTNVPSTPTVWCPVCNRYDKPHDHVLNDGRH